MTEIYTNQFKTQWNDERIKELRQQLAQGKSATQIALTMGTSRNAIIGKIYRMGELMGQLNGYYTRHPGRAPKKTRLRTVVYRTYAAFIPETLMCAEYVTQPTEATTGEPCDILSLTKNTCRWPLWDGPNDQNKQYCGAPSCGKVYCKEHLFMAGPLYRRPVENQPASSPPSASP